jgi:hypothetical protein
VLWGWTGIVAWILGGFILVASLSLVVTRPPRRDS